MISQESKGRLLWAAWMVSVALAGFAPLLRAITHVHGIHRWPVAIAVAVMGLTWFLIRKSPLAFTLAISMSASGIAIGAGIGFLSIAVGSGRTLNYLLALQWTLGGVFLTAMFIRQLRADEKLIREEEEAEKERERLSQMAPAELEARFRQWQQEYLEATAQLKRGLRRQYICLGIAIVLAVGAFVVLRMMR